MIKEEKNMPSKKIVCLGGGSLQCSELFGDLAIIRELKGSEIVLYDIDKERAKLMAKCGKRLSDKAGANFKIYATSNLSESLDGADFAVSNISGARERGGNYYSSKVHVNDLLISSKYGIFQIIGDTAGPAAMMSAFRTIPIYLNIYREMKKRCPNVIFINHANPLAILCRVMNKYTNLRDVIGLCHGVQHGTKHVAGILEVPPEELDTIWIGTDHYHWFTEIYHKGKDLYPELRKRMSLRKSPSMCAKLSQIYGYQIVYPADSHSMEFYPFLAQVKKSSNLPYGLLASFKERTQRKPGNRKEFKALLDKATLPEKDKQPFTAPINLASDKIIESIATGRRDVHIVNIPNRGSVPNLPDFAVLEVEGVTDSHGIRPIYAGKAPLALKGHLEKIIAWQELVVDAGVKGDKNLALQALMLDPMAIIPEKAEAMLDELLTNSKEFLPQFKKGKSC